MDILRSMETDPVPSFKGAKFVTQDLTDFSLCVNVSKGKFQMIYALDGVRYEDQYSHMVYPNIICI